MNKIIRTLEKYKEDIFINVIDLRESKGEDFTVFLFEDTTEGKEIMFFSEEVMRP